jgi:N-methylhydantoinase A
MYRISVDVGGTFTDLVAFNEETGNIYNVKTPTVPKNPEHSVINALRHFLNQHNPEDIRMLGHATTIATNSLLGQINLDLPRTAFITTEGFRDVIEIGRQRRAEVYNLFFERPPMLVERKSRYVVKERINSKGDVVISLNPSDLDEIIKNLRKEKVDSVAIGYINSYVNPIHENQTFNILSEKMPEIFLTASHMISNEYREYERFSTAVVNAVLMPVMRKYLTNLEIDLIDHSVAAPVYVMQSNGGLALSEIIQTKPATVVESGPAAGVIASAWLGDKLGVKNIISFDMGGTTAKAGIVRGRVPEVVPEYEVAGKIHMGRIIKGSGYPVRFPFIDLAECSAGGGTIARAISGALEVGPISAGAIPGPACYGLGGQEPTITDANLILGRLNPKSLLNGEMRIHVKPAENAFQELADQLGLTLYSAAVSVIRVANSMMSKILRIVSVERGFDPRNFTLVAFGGAGPMHVCALAEDLKINRVIVPPNPGMFSALGLLTADLFHDYSSPIVSDMSIVNPSSLEKTFKIMEEKGIETLSGEGIPEDLRKTRRSLDLRYKGQGYELNVQIGNHLTEEELLKTVKKFHKKHDEIYGYFDSDQAVEIVNAKLRVIGELDKPELSTEEKIEDKNVDYRNVYFETLGEWVNTPIYTRGSLVGEYHGPAIVEQYDSTIIVYPEWSFRVDKVGNLILRGKGR